MAAMGTTALTMNPHLTLTLSPPIGWERRGNIFLGTVSQGIRCAQTPGYFLLPFQGFGNLQVNVVQLRVEILKELDPNIGASDS